MALFFFAGILAALIGLSGYLFPAIRNVEDILPDHEATGGDDPEAETGKEPAMLAGSSATEAVT